jgi:hypothetical protein
VMGSAATHDRFGFPDWRRDPLRAGSDICLVVYQTLLSRLTRVRCRVPRRVLATNCWS